MGATYTRQSSAGIVDGGVIEAVDLNAEFDQLLAAFAVTTGHTHDGTTAEGGPIASLLGTAITIGDGTAGTDIAVTFDGESNNGILTWMEDEDYFQFSDDLLLTTTEKLQFRDTAIYINSSVDGQLDLVADTEIQIAATTIDINGNVDISGNIIFAGSILDVNNNEHIKFTTTASAVNELTITNNITGSNPVISATGSDTNIGIVLTPKGSGEIVIATDDLNYAGTAITSTGSELNLLDGSIANTVVNNKAVIYGSSGQLAGTLSTAAQTNITSVGTLSSVVMSTNTSGNILVADGTNFTSKAVGDLSEISVVANDDVFLAVDTSGGGLKKISRSTIISGLASSGAISNVVEDTTPQLGGNLDMNGQDIVTTSNATIDLAPNGTGNVVVRGNTNPGAIVFNCESNSHGQTVRSQPHSASVTNVLTLPPGSDQEIVGASATQTLTNKTLTTPVIAEIDSGSTITLDATTDVILDADSGDVFFKDGGTTFGSANNTSGNLIIKSGTTTALTFSGANVTLAGDLTISGDDIIMATNTSGAALIADGTNFNPVVISGDISIGSTGTAAIGSGVIVNADIANSTINLTTKVTGTLPVANGGTGLAALGTSLQVLRTNSGATALEFGTLSLTLSYSSGTDTGDGSDTTFTISSGRTVEDVLVFVNGFQLTPTTDYTISGTTLTFVTAPASSAEICYRYLPIVGTYTSASFTGNGSSTTITIDAGRAVDNVLVVVNGLTLVPTDDYTIASTTLTFATAPTNLAEITVRYLRLS